MKHFIFLLIIVMFLFSCGSKNQEAFETASESFDEYEEALEELPDNEQADMTELIPRKIIKTGYMETEVKNLAAEKRRVDSMVNHFKGYYDEERLENTNYWSTYNLIIRIPAEHFTRFISMLENGDAEIINKNIETKDITEEYVDLETRLANKRNFMTRYQELLKGAGNIGEILEIQERIRSLEEEIESTMGRLKYLSAQVTYSKLHLEISQRKDYKYKPAKRSDVSEKLKQSFFGGWHAFVDFLYILLYIWVLILLVIAAVILLMIRRRRIRRRKLRTKDKTT